MSVSASTRRWMLFAAAAVVGVLALLSDEPVEDDGILNTARVSEAAAPKRAPSSDKASVPQLQLARLDRLAQRTVSAQEPSDPFALPAAAPTIAEKQASPVASSPPPAPPEAPTLPFRYLGSQETNGKRQVFLEQQQQTHIVTVGDTVGNAWRLDSVSDQAAIFTYMPLGQQRRLSVGGPG